MSSRRGTSPALPRASDCRPPDSAHIRGGRGIQAQLLCRALDPNTVSIQGTFICAGFPIGNLNSTG